MKINRFLIRMSLAGIMVLALLILLAPTLWPIFQTSMILNGAILGVLLLGVGYTVRQVIALKPELRWLEEGSQYGGKIVLLGKATPKILSPLAALLGKNAPLSTMNLRLALDSVDSRLQESRDISRYMVGLLVFLGLLGTFWGLSITIKSVSSVIANLSTGENEVVNFLDQLKTGLQSPLEGMGVAFSSSLFGLSSSLILGFFELQAGQARHCFFKEVEENLTNQSISSSSHMVNITKESNIPAYIQALLEQTAENLDGLQRVTARNEQERQMLNSNLSTLCDKFSVLIDQRETEKNLLMKIAEGLIEFQKQLKIFSLKISENNFGLDDATKQHIRGLNEGVHQLLKATTAGQETLTKEIRDEIRVLTKTLTNLASEPSALSA